MIVKNCIFVIFGLSLMHLSNCEMFKVTSHIGMKISQDGKPIGRIVFGLFGELAPKTVLNFQTICGKGIDGVSYKGSIFHRVINKFMIQGGDIVSGDGNGAISIYGKYFEDENLEINHTGPGFLAMANKGPDTNGCQFYITTLAAPWLNGKHTIFGKIVDGNEVPHIIEKIKTDTDDIPNRPVIITECTVEPINAAYMISDNPYDMWAWVRASVVPLGMSFTILAIFHYFIRKLDKYII